MPVVQYYREHGVVYEIPATGTKDEVYVQVRAAVDEILGTSASSTSAPAPTALPTAVAAATTL